MLLPVPPFLLVTAITLLIFVPFLGAKILALMTHRHILASIFAPISFGIMVEKGYTHTPQPLILLGILDVALLYSKGICSS
jgi:hypothetical protein